MRMMAWALLAIGAFGLLAAMFDRRDQALRLGAAVFILAVVGMLLWLTGLAQAQPRPDPRSYWPAEGRIGVAAQVASRAGGCRLSFILLNNTTTHFRDITLTVEVARSASLTTVTDVTFRLVDSGRLRDADAWTMRGCERRPRIMLRGATCSTGPLAYRDCIGLFVPVIPPARGAELARVSVGAEGGTDQHR